MVKYLVNARDGSHWQTTADTGPAVSALVDYLTRNAESTGEYPISVSLNGKNLFNDNVTSARLLNYPGKVVIPAQELKAGRNTCVINAGENCRSLPYSSMLRFFSLQEDIPAEGKLR